ncbi:MAG: hypothetical protein KC492_46165 [Myxococcales bacterium]|nr:hypothetical protein [Myxococcales bacterium]
MSTTKPLSTAISAELREQLDTFAERRGLKKKFVVEEALRMFMATHDELPHIARTPVRLVLSDEAFDELQARLEAPPARPTHALLELMRED